MSDFYDVGQESRNARDTRLVILEAVQILFLILALAFCFRTFLYRTFAVPGYSMSATLLPGDQVLGNQFIYGPLMPVTGKRLFTLRHPEPGDVVVFRDPAQGDRPAIRRAVAGPGDRIRIQGKKLFLNDVRFDFPKTAQAGDDFLIDGRFSPRDELPPFRVPLPGDRLSLDTLSLHEFDFVQNLIRQENPEARITQTADLFINGKAADDLPFDDFNSERRKPDGALNYDVMTWQELKNVLNFLSAKDDSLSAAFKRSLYMDGREIKDYTVKSRCLFMLGDNWDESMDSRFTGYVTEARVMARADLILFSRWSGEIRWRRMFLFL